MPITFQYNKTSMQALERQMQSRLRALPVLKNKEAALRMEVKRTRRDIAEVEAELARRKKQVAELTLLWPEFDMDLVSLEHAETATSMVASVKVPELRQVSFAVQPYSQFSRPHWYGDGIDVLKGLAAIAIKREFLVRRAELLDKARKRTTQKVNLFEKNQIPAFEEAITKIKRFLEDEDNLAKSSQKILKQRLQRQAGEALGRDGQPPQTPTRP